MRNHLHSAEEDADRATPNKYRATLTLDPEALLPPPPPYQVSQHPTDELMHDFPRRGRPGTGPEC